MDTRTILVISVALNVPILMFLIQGRLRRSHVLGQADWIAGILLVWLASLLMVLRGVIPDFLAIVLGNACWMTSLLFFAIGSYKFLELPKRLPVWIYVAFALALLTVGIFTYVPSPWPRFPAINVRVMAATLAGLLLGIVALTQIRKTPSRLSPCAEILRLPVVGFVLVTVLRLFGTLVAPLHDVSLFHGSAGQAVLVFGLLVVDLMVAWGVVFATNRRLEVERAEKVAALSEREQHVQRFWEAAPIALFSVTQEGKLSFRNRRFEQQLGYTLVEIPTIEAFFGQVFPDPVQRDAQKPRWQALLAGRGPLEDTLPSFESTLRCKEGRVRTFSVQASVIGGESLVTLFDVSARAEAQRALLAAKEEAERATRSKSLFLANMSHELRTPMNAILGLSQLARENLADQDELRETRHFLTQIHSAAGALLGILNDILDVSKLEAGKLDIEHAPFDLQAVIDQQQLLHGQKVKERGLSLSVSLSPDVPRFLVGDSLRLGQILTNLLGNAVKFTERGGVSLEITLAAEGSPPRQDQRMVRFAVRDTGIGMDAAQVAALGQPFVQADASTTRKFGGSGLGLYICKQLAQRMGGALSVESEPGRGSLFVLTAPFDPAPTSRVRPLAVDAERSAQFRPIPQSLPAMRVLIVEDNQINQLVAQRFLEKIGAKTVLAQNGQEALDVLRARHDIDLVLMDVQMPVMDGLEATQRIRSDLGRTDLPIVAMTAHAFPEERERCISSGMNDHIAKPISAAGLSEVLLRWLPTLPAH